LHVAELLILMQLSLVN